MIKYDILFVLHIYLGVCPFWANLFINLIGHIINDNISIDIIPITYNNVHFFLGKYYDKPKFEVKSKWL